MKDNIVFLLNRSEIGAGTRGSSIGVDALMLSAINKGSSIFKHTPRIELHHQNHVLTETTNHKWAKYIDALVPVYEEVCNKMYDTLRKDHFPIVISGDHASAGGTIAGIRKVQAHPNKRIGIIWIDAHADLHSPYTSPSGNVHGMPLATVINEDNLDSRDACRYITDETKKAWEKLKKVGGHTPKAQAKDLVFIGVRDTEQEEDYLIKKYAIPNYTPELLRKQGIRQTIHEIKKKLEPCDVVYISFDVDSLDPKSVSYGTGTPVENGLFVDEAKELLKAFLSWDKVISLEITEINPLLDDKKNKMAETALEILEYAVFNTSSEQTQF